MVKLKMKEKGERTLSGNSVSKIKYVVERKGSRARRFVQKHFFDNSRQEVFRFKEIHSFLKKFNIPTSKIFESHEKDDRLVIRQKDYSWSMRVVPNDAFRQELTSSLVKRAFLGVIRDLGVMHKQGMVTSAKEELFAPWIIYKKPNGKMDRAVVDYGTLQIDKRSEEQKNNYGKYFLTEHNFQVLLTFLRGTDKKFMKDALRVYFTAFPESPNREHFQKLFSQSK